MYITQCKYKEDGVSEWKDLNKWFYLYEARRDLEECKKDKTYTWRIVDRIKINKIIDKVVK